MKKTYFALPMLTFAALFAASCQSDIDLNDIDTNVAMSVNELTVPIKLDKVKLDAVLDIDDNDKNIKKMVDPETGNTVYAVVKEGTFESDDIKLDPVKVAGGTEYAKQTLGAALQTKSGQNNVRGRRTPSGEYYIYDLAASLNDLKSKIDLTKYEGDIDPKKIDIEQIGDISVDFTVKTTLDLAKQLVGMVNEATLQNVAIKLIEGMEETTCFEGYVSIGGKKCIDGNISGLLNITESIPVIPGETTELVLHVDKIYGDAIRKFVDLYETTAVKGQRRAADQMRHFRYDAEFGFESGELAIAKEDLAPEVTVEDLPQTLYYDAVPSTEEMKITKFSGHVEYNLEEKINIPNVELKDLPDFLADQGTEIKLQNPQLYIKLHNPVLDGDKKPAKAQTGFTFTNWFTQNSKATQGNEVKLADDAIIADKTDNVFCISSSKVTKMYKGFEGATLIDCPTLGNILSTNEHGLPNNIEIKANGCMVNDDVNNLDLNNTNFGKAKGSYLFYVPLALGKGSKIAYSDKADGWYSEDLENLTVKTVHLTANVTTDVPLKLTLSVKPLNTKGEAIKNVKVETPTLEPNAKNQKIDLKIEGDIKQLDGMEFNVTLSQDNEGSAALSPNMNIELKNIRVTVSGNYEKEL